MTILVMGDVIDDLIVTTVVPMRIDTDTPAAIERRAGGSAANVAAWLGHLGADVDFIGTVGAEDVARHASELAEHGVTARLIGDSEASTGTIIILVSGEHRSMLTERGANLLTGPDSLPPLASYNHLHLTGHTILGAPATEWQRVIADAHDAGLTVSIDPGSAGFIADSGVDTFLEAIAGADVLLPNLDEGRLLAGIDEPTHVAERLAKAFPLVVLTMGSRGVLVADGDGVASVVATSAQLVDSTGAGDAFTAAFLAAWLDGRTPVDAASAATFVAARAVARAGGRPTRD